MILNFFNFRLQYNPELSFTRLQWFPNQNGMKYFRPAMEQLASLMEQDVVQYTIVDMHNLPNVSLEDQFWTATSWLPRAASPFLKQAAMVFPASGLYNQLAIEGILLLGRRLVKFDTQFFSSVDEALDWQFGQYDPATQQVLEAEWNKDLIHSA